MNPRRDHEIIHLFAERPETASVYHPLVKNDKYGISHTVAYDQTLLTPEQIKSMHDKWVEMYDDPLTHSTPLNFPSSKETKWHSRWDEVVIFNPKTKQQLTKRDIFRYYADPRVKKKIFTQIKDTPIVMRQAMAPGES
jgi:hypothetical protein